MPSFDIVSEVDTQELDNAINQARKELATRFDFKGITAEIVAEKDKITLTAQDGGHLRGLREIMVGKLSKRGVDLRNIEQEEPAISSVGHARQELKIQQGLEGNKAKEIIQAIKSQGFKVQSQLQDRQIRVTGKKKDDLQAVIQFVRSRDLASPRISRISATDLELGVCACAVRGHSVRGSRNLRITTPLAAQTESPCSSPPLHRRHD